MAIATEHPTATTALRDERVRLRARLARLRRRLTLESVLEFAADVALALVVAAALLVLVDWWFRLELPARRILLPIAGVGLAAFALARAVRRWRAARVDDLGLALVLDRFRPGTGQRVADVLQLPDLLDEERPTASPDLVRLAVRRAAESLDASDWERLWNRRRTAARAGLLATCLLAPALFVALAPETARLSVARWLLGSNERWPQRTYLSVVGLGDDGQLVAPKDEPFLIEVRSDLPNAREGGQRRGDWAIGGRGEPMTVRSPQGRPRSTAPAAVTVRERIAGRGRRAGVMVATTPDQFRYEFPPANGSSTFELMGGDDWLGPIAIVRRDRPTLRATAIRVREPGATYEGFREIAGGRQNLAFLPDTEIELTLVGSEPVGELNLDVRPEGTPTPERIDASSFRTRWSLKEATTLEVRLTSADSGLESRPAFLSLGLLRDREPRLTLRAAGVGARVTPIATIPLDMSASDDLGLAALRLQIDRTPPAQEDEATVPTPARQSISLPLPGEGVTAPRDHQVRHEVTLQADPPAVGTLLKIVAEADDACARGIQTGRSGPLQLQVVAIDELFYEILVRQRAERAKFVAALEAAEKQGPALADQPTRDAYLGAMRALHSVSRQVDQIGARIADTLEEMKLNQVGSPKSHRLLQEGVIDPIRELNAGPMTEARGMLQALAGGATKAGTDAESARRAHGDVVNAMRVILEQMSQWESFVDVVNQVAEVIEMEKKVLEATKQAREARTEEVFDANP